MESVEDLFRDAVIPRTERLYSGLRPGAGTKDALGALGELRALVDRFYAHVDSVGDEELRKAAARHRAHLEELFLRIRRYLEDAAAGPYAQEYADEIRHGVSSLHLLLNNLHEIAREIDRHYVKRPHLMVLDIPPCSGCQGGTCPSSKGGTDEGADEQ
ncbi:MAG: hypothetical protein PHW58_07510 [Candidatus Methanofastidiosa archaeon]|nr:hypothetical protein [Candidatus Methanofastidiosa archaeon]MDD4282053.1 hypothetical protein [Candidatus Methanofastidiosa archaeon]